jgi:hypothetical protein
MKHFTAKSLRVETRLAETIICVLLLILAIYLTLNFNAKFNPDLRNSVKILDFVSDIDFGEALFQNSLLFFWLQKASVVFEINYLSILYIFYATIQCIFVFVLLKYFRPLTVLQIILFTFFTVVLNQARFALSVSIISYLVYLDNLKLKVNPLWKIILLIISFFFHVFAGVIYIIFLVTKKYPKTMSISMLLSLLVIPIILKSIEETRFLFYISEDAERGSFTFIFLILFLIVLIKNLTKSEKYFFVTMTIVVVLTYRLPSISSRIGELVTIFLFLIVSRNNSVSLITKIVILGLTLLFFVYRGTSWFIFDAIPGPV